MDLQLALQLAADGVPVFPCNARTKGPIPARSFYAATTDVAQIHEWVRQYPASLIGIPTGSVTGIACIDVDPDGMDWLQLNRGKLSTRFHATRRGFHFLFSCVGLDVFNSQNRIAPGVDVRGNGGYIVWWSPATITEAERKALPLMPDEFALRRLRAARHRAMSINYSGERS
jgi:putative DNA primase/helicase